jgi:hypothetical protein
MEKLLIPGGAEPSARYREKMSGPTDWVGA